MFSTMQNINTLFLLGLTSIKISVENLLKNVNRSQALSKFSL